METIKSLFIRLRQSAVLLLIGFFLIIYIALGFLYFQQGPKQRALEEQIAQFSIVVSNQPPSSEKLQAEYDEANSALTSMPRKAVIAILVDIAKKSGIDVDSEDNKFGIPAAADKTVDRKVGEGSYQVLSFTNIRVQGDYDKVIAFISALESGETLQTMVLKRVDISQTDEETTATLDVDLYTKAGGDSS